MAASARPHDVHDRLVKRVFGRKRAFAVELRHVLPQELVSRLDLHTLRRHSTERTDERLRSRISDLCFTADLVDGERRHLVYFPLEHVSTTHSLFPLRVADCVTGLWHEHVADHPDTHVLPFIAPILLTQPPARNTSVQLSTILDVPADLHALVPSPIDVRAYVDDLSGSVLDDPEADAATLAFVEIARAFLHAHGNPASLTKERLAELAPLFDVLLDQREPLASHDVRALLTYVLRAFPEGSPVRALVRNALRGRSRAMFVSIADSLVAEGRKAGITEGRKAGITEGRKAGITEGRKAGIVRALLRLLERRFSAVPDAVRRRVSSTRDERRLLRWLDRAATAASLAEVFAPDE